MMQITCLDDIDQSPVSISTGRRNRVYAEFLARLKDGTVVDGTQGDIAVVLARLAEKNLLDFCSTGEEGETVITHVPSASAAKALSMGVNTWPDSVSKRIAKSIRMSSGALFSFPYETGDGTLEVFITDWSPCPAACALAVHRMHPIVRSRQLLPEANTFFTGLYVRHPLTGDLLPVWVADWVKPDFGTGAVLVNPAHNLVDLKFGREIGLPIRFALMPPGCSDSPENWPLPPVIKTGTVLKSGSYDGMSVDEAQIAYRNELVSRNLAKDHIDIHLPTHPIAKLTLDETGAWLWKPQYARIGLAEGDAAVSEGEALRVTLDPGPMLTAAAAVAAQGAELVLMGATVQKSAVAGFAALLVDLMNGSELPVVQVIQTAEYSGTREFDNSMRLAYLVAGDQQQAVTVRKQLLEQTDSFLSAVASINDRLTEVGEIPPKSVTAALDCTHPDPVSAFRDMYKWQKEMLKSEKPINAEAYKTVLFALVGKH